MRGRKEETETCVWLEIKSEPACVSAWASHLFCHSGQSSAHLKPFGIRGTEPGHFCLSYKDIVLFLLPSYLCLPSPSLSLLPCACLQKSSSAWSRVCDSPSILACASNATRGWRRDLSTGGGARSTPPAPRPHPFDLHRLSLIPSCP